MIDVSVNSWLLLLFYFIVASLAGLSLSKLFPWSMNARNAKLPMYWGLAIAPFLLGLAGVLTLNILPGASHLQHQITIIGLLLATTALSVFYKIKYHLAPIASTTVSPNDRLNTFALIILIIGLFSIIVSVLFLPLTQNDPLEYLMVSKILFEQRSLAVYPIIDPLISSSGFFAPWTHPPLYVTLMYIMDLIQGHANFPGLTRFVAPWFSITSVMAIYSTGILLKNRSAGLISALIMLSTPLFFLGADSALIDSLPISGFLLAIILVFSLDNNKGFIYPALIGFTLGASMWTHSQAILYPILLAPIFILKNIRKPIHSQLTQFILLYVSMLVVAVWPYLHNYKLFHSIISDNPAVFALHNLNWVEYFEVSRGYFTIIDKVQFGVFKGWFMLESYAFTFWLMSLGLFYYIRKQGFISQVNKIEMNGLNICILLVGMYVAGVILSLVVGTDLMIKNERYLLIILPFVSLIGGVGLAHRLENKSKKTNCLYTAFLTAMLLQIVCLNVYKLVTMKLSPSNLLASHESKLDTLPNLLAIKHLKSQSTEDAIVLAMRPSDMYYSQRTMISYLDPRLLTFYQEADINKATQLLLDLNIRYIQVPNYTLPVLYNSNLQNILNDPQKTKLIFSSSGNQLYELTGDSKPMQTSLFSHSTDWNVEYFLSLMGRKGLFQILLDSEEAKKTEDIVNDNSDSITDRYLTHFIWSPYVSLKDILSAGKTTAEIKITMALAGSGFARIQIRCLGYKTTSFIKRGHILRPYLLPVGDLILQKDTETNVFSKRLFVHENEIACQFGTQSSVSNNVVIKNIELDKIQSHE